MLGCMAYSGTAKTSVAFVRAGHRTQPAQGSGASETDSPVELLTLAGAVRAAARVGPALVQPAPSLILLDACRYSEDVIARARALQPDVLVLGRSGAEPLAPFTRDEQEGLIHLGLALKAASPTSLRVALVPEDTDQAAAILTEGAAHVVIRGDADEVLPRVLAAARGRQSSDFVGLHGTSHRREDGTIAHEISASLPLKPATPAWDLIDLATRKNKLGDPLQAPRLNENSARAPIGLVVRASRALRTRIGPGSRLSLRPARPSASIRTSRACSNGCPTCRGSFGASGPERSVQDVLAEVRELVTRRGVRELRILDHAFDGNPARATEIVRGVARMRRAPGLQNLRVVFPKGFRGDGLTDPLVDALLELGVERFDLRVVTAAERLQRLFKLNVKLDEASDALLRIEQRGATGRLVIGLGFPSETTGEAAHTVQWAASSAARELLVENGRSSRIASTALVRPDEIDDFKALKRRAVRAFFRDTRRGPGRLARAGLARVGLQRGARASAALVRSVLVRGTGGRATKGAMGEGPGFDQAPAFSESSARFSSTSLNSSASGSASFFSVMDGH